MHTHETGNRSKPHITQRRISVISNNLRHKGPELWYSIPEEISSIKTIKSSSKHVKKELINKYLH